MVHARMRYKGQLGQVTLKANNAIQLQRFIISDVA